METFLDAVLAIEEHIDPSLMRPKLAWTMEDVEFEEKTLYNQHHMMNFGNRGK